MDLNEKLAAHQRELAIDAEKAEQVLESSTAQLPPIPNTRHLSCIVATKYVDNIRKTRNEYGRIIALVPLGVFALFALINEMGWARITINPAYLAFCVGIFALTWWLFGRWIAQLDSWSATELDFSENSLRISYRLLKAKPELIIPWSAIQDVGHILDDAFGSTFVILIQDIDIARHLRTSIKNNFGSSLWIPTPWIGSFSDAWWVRIFNKYPPRIRILIKSPPAIELLNLINAWRDSVTALKATHDKVAS